MNLFRLYWFNTHTGFGHPTIRYPDEMTYEQAHAIVGNGHKVRRDHLELHMEPVEIFNKYTIHNDPL